MSFNHRKKRNTGLVYEFLIRRMADQMIEKDRAGYDRTLTVVARHYGEGSLISDERKLFDIVRQARATSREHGYRILSEVAKHAKAIDNEALEKEKSSLLKEVNYTCGKELFSSYRIPEYRLLATIQLFLDGARKDSLHENMDRITLEESLVSHMMAKKESEESKPASDEVDNLVCALAGRKFEEKYGRSLSKEQSKLLTKYVKSTLTEDSTFLPRFVEAERVRCLGVLKESRGRKEFADDKVMAGKLDEVITNLSGAKGRFDESFIEDMMLVYGLVREVSSDE